MNMTRSTMSVRKKIKMFIGKISASNVLRNYHMGDKKKKNIIYNIKINE